MRAAALRRLTQRLGRQSLQSSRCEDTSVDAVNAWLAEPPSKPTWTIAGACAAHDVFDLNADVVVAVDEGDEPCEPWVAATRIAVPQPPVALGSAAADALPDELADDALLAMAPERLTFALCGVGTAETVFERLESLFPGARAVACAAPAGRAAAGGRTATSGEERRSRAGGVYGFRAPAGRDAARARVGRVLDGSGGSDFNPAPPAAVPRQRRPASSCRRARPV